MTECTLDSGDNYPYTQETFTLIARLARLIKKYSREFGVPPLAVAGSIADEYNTRRGGRIVLDWIQDYVVLNRMPNRLIQIDYNHGARSRWLNATRHDLGPGNINLKTARDIYKQFSASFPKRLSDWADMVDYLLTDEGSVVVTALVIKKGMNDMAASLVGRSPGGLPRSRKPFW